MSKVREILRLKFYVGLSLRDIAASCNRGKSTMDNALKRAQKQTSLGHVISMTKNLYP